MTVAGGSGKAENMESWEITTTGSEKRPEELESDVDHKEMIKAYASDSYLSRWLPDIKDEQRIAENHLNTSDCQETKREEHKELCIIQQGSNSVKSPSQNRPQQETLPDDTRDIKVPQENRKKTYFEAIKCSPMKLRRSIVTQNRSKTEDNFAVKQHSGDQMDETGPTANTELVPSVDEMASDHLSHTGNQVNPETNRDSSNPVDDKKSVTKNTVIPRKVEMTDDPSGQLGSLCFKTEDAERRRSDVAYSSYNMAGGKMHKIHRSSRKTITRTKRNNELLVRCESVMIYPKILVNPRTEKLPTKSLYPKEAWLEDGLGRPSLSSKTNEDYTRLPDLEARENVMSQNISNRKLSPEHARSPTQKPRANSQNSQRSASTKIIIPFGEGQLKQTNEKNAKSEKQLVQKPEDVKASETESSQIKDVSNNEQNSRKNRRYFNDSNKTCHPNFSETPRRKISGMIIGITRLEIPKRTPLITQHLAFAHQDIYPVAPRSPTKRFKFPTTDANDLFLGRENLSVTRNGPRFTYNQRKRLDISRKCNHHTASQLYEDEHEGSRYFLSNEGNLSLAIGGTGLFKEQRSLQDNFEGGKQINDADKKRVHFNVLVPHSRYFT